MGESETPCQFCGSPSERKIADGQYWDCGTSQRGSHIVRDWRCYRDGEKRLAAQLSKLKTQLGKKLVTLREKAIAKRLLAPEINKSKWDISDWYQWLYQQSDGEVVAELSQQAELLGRALEVVMVCNSKTEMYRSMVQKSCQINTPGLDSIISQTQAIILDIEKALEETK